MHNAWVRDERLEWDDVGLLTYLHSHKEGYVIKIAELVALRSAGRHRIDVSIERLETFGYLLREPVRNASGYRTGTRWILLDPTS